MFKKKKKKRMRAYARSAPDVQDDSKPAGLSEATTPVAVHIRKKVCTRGPQSLFSANTVSDRKARVDDVATDTATQSTRSAEAHQSVFAAAAVDVSADKLDKVRVRDRGKRLPKPTGSNVRGISVMDFKPDICKDFMDFGYCGRGDTCKFRHDREEYKSGWQLEREYEMKKERDRRKALGLTDSSSSGESSDKTGKGTANANKRGARHTGAEKKKKKKKPDVSFPSVCMACRKPFEHPVVTICKHYFCEACALAHHSKSRKCLVCKERTNGVFNPAVELERHLALRKAKEKMRAERREMRRSELAAIRKDR